MYESHFGFTSRPFLATPDAECFFPNENSRKAFDSIVSCVQRATGAALIVGGSGLGKSTLLRALGKHFQQEYSVAILESASINSRKELLQNILFELGLPFHGMEEGELRLNLMDYLKPSERCPNGLLLCVDEAHLLSANLLEEMRMITNLVRNGQPRARLVLAGNTSIEEHLAEPKMESLSQRISTRAYLDSLNETECRQYIADWLNAVGKSTDELFDRDAVAAVFTATHGIPRLINQVCDHALVLAVANGQSRITQSLINEAWSDIQRLPVDWNVLGTQTQQTNEHVIEFGELKTFAEDDSNSQTPEPAVSLEGHQEEVESSPEEEPAVEEETVSEIFVFKGPRNPFDEEFEEEETVIDSFSQIIGHTPKLPSFPTSATPSTNTRNPSHADPITSDKATPESTDPELTPPNPIETEPASPVALTGDPVSIDMNLDIEESAVPTEPTSESTLDHASDGIDLSNAELAQSSVETQSDGVNESDQPVAEASEDRDSHQEPTQEGSESSLDDYLANTREAITFGVGQGIYADKFDTDPADKLEQKEPVAEHSDESGPDAEKLETLEEEISQTVEELQSGVDQGLASVDQSSAASESKPAEPSDDRDMIVVEEETPKNETDTSEVDTVPMRDSDSSQASSQAKREDYKQLFDRLRNG